MKTRLFSVLLVLCFAVGWLPFSVNAEEIEEYSLSDGMETPIDICFVPTLENQYVWMTLPVDEGTRFNDWYDELPEPEREGYKFLNWSTSDWENAPFDPNQEIWKIGSRAIYLYGFWEEDTTVSYKVTFMVDGEVYDEITAEDGIICEDDMPQEPEKDGAVFKQWQTEDGEPFTGTADSDVTLYPRWYDSIITYDPNGNLPNGEFQPEWYPADDGDRTPQYSGELKMDTHDFLGWEPELSETVSGSVQYTAIWKEKPTKTFTLTYDPNADNDPSVPKIPPESYTTYDLNMEFHEFTAAPVLTRTGFSFVSWNTAADGSGTAVAPGEAFSVDEAAVLHAVWERETCQVTFEGGEAVECLWGDCLSADCIPTPALDETGCAVIDGIPYRFDGWNTSVDGLGEPFTAGSPVEGSLTLYPRWIEQVEVTFHIENGTWVETGSDTYVLILDIDTPLADRLPTALPDTQHKDGRWNTEPTAASRDDSFTFTCDPRAVFTLTFTDGEESTTRELFEGEPVGALPVLTKTGWNFLGWYDGDIPVTAETEVTADMVLEAKWEQLFSLSFDPNGGEEPPESLTGPGPHRIPAISPHRLGYHFLGWSLSPESETVQFETDDPYIPVGEDVLYAVWEPEEYEIRYNDGVKTSVIFPDQVYTAAYDEETPAFSGRPTRKNYAFLGWKPAVSETVTGTALYEAQWVKATNPKTDDQSGIELWITLMLLSGASLLSLCVFKKRR